MRKIKAGKEKEENKFCKQEKKKKIEIGKKCGKMMFRKVI